MIPLVAFEKIVPGSLRPRRAARDPAGTATAWVSRCSATFGHTEAPLHLQFARRRDFEQLDTVAEENAEEFSPRSRVTTKDQRISEIRMGLIAPTVPDWSLLRSAPATGCHHLDGIIKADHLGVMESVYSDRTWGMLAAVARKPRAGEQS